MHKNNKIFVFISPIFSVFKATNFKIFAVILGLAPYYSDYFFLSISP